MMAAPPLPPKGSPTSWSPDPHSWRMAESQGSFPARSGFSDNFVQSLPQTTSEAPAPPLPPRPSASALRASQHRFDRTELINLVVPPPGSYQMYHHPTHIAVCPGNTPLGPIQPGGSTTGSFQNIAHFRNSIATVQNFNTTRQFNSNLQRSVSTNRQPLAFTNSLYQSQYGFDIQHSKSAPHIPNQSVPLSRYSMPPNANFAQSKVVYASINPQHSTQTNLENILKFVKKRSDSNLIDLYCGDSELNSNNENRCEDDILSLFDPLSTPMHLPINDNDIVMPEKGINASEITGKMSTTYTQPMPTPKPKPELQTETLPKQAYKAPPCECNGKEKSVLKIIPKNDNYNREFDSFCQKLKKLRADFAHDDHVTNAGLVISPTLDSYQEDSLSIKLIINSVESEKPVSFTCDVSTSVEHIISHTVCSIFENTSNICMDNFVLKVHGLSEYFTSHSALADYEYVHQCHKFDKPVCLTLTDIKDLRRPLARVKTDDANDVSFKYTQIAPLPKKEMISYDSLNILLDTLEREIERIKCSALKCETGESLKPQGVVQAVKAICTLLSHVETSEITDAVAAYIQVCLLYDKNQSQESEFDTLPELGNLKNPKDQKSEKDLLSLFQLLELSLLHLQHAVLELFVMYSKAFRVNFEVEISDPVLQEKLVTDFLDTPLFEVGIVHRLDPATASSHENFYLECEICYGGTLLTSMVSRISTVTKSFFPRLVYEEWLQFGNISMCTLPQESVLYFTLWGDPKLNESKSSNNNNPSNKSMIGWCGVRLFSYDGELAQGCFLLGFWPPEVIKNSGPLLSNPHAKCPLLHMRLPEFGCIVKFPPVIDNKFAVIQRRNFDQLDPPLQSQLREVIQKDTLKNLQAEEKELLWEKKQFLHQFPNALPKILLSAHGWDWACLSDIYSLLKAWSPMKPVESLHLLMPTFPNREVRKTAIKWMKDIVSDELCDYLPQMVQILRYEIWDDSPTAWFLLERSLTSIRVAHHLYWLLKENINDPVVGDRMRLMLNSLLTISGQAMRERIKSQEMLLEDLSNIASKIKNGKEALRLSCLLHELEKTHHTIMETPTCLPLSPSLEVCGVDVKSCSYFTSNTLPLKLVFLTPEMAGTKNEAIFKDGDDLRQDMITLQMIRIMDKLWLKDGLDLKIVTFTCVATEYRKGIVEMVPDSETLRKIQTELGLTGSFKDRPIAEWLQKYNTSELEYQQAVENFTLSCAGYCVATYILGICDRHNDNIMLKTSGHIFHIDFGKFLGDSQMFGSIKRDRTPFVLTSDMAFVINGGDKPSKKFQYFIDLCCQAFNIIRSHKDVFFNLFSLMTSSGIPGMSANAVSYIEKALLPDMSEAEATVHFTQMIQESLKSWFTQFNFFIHNLAQMRFTGDHNDGLMLSFTPKTYSKESDGKILVADVIGYRKLYDPEKYYIYVVKVERERQPDPMVIFRTYREFIEFHQKLCMMFPLAKFHALPGNPLMGRTNVREVADKRKSELSVFLRSLLVMAEEIAHSDLVYSFMHPILRDQEGIESENETQNHISRSRRSSSLTEIHGQVKVSIVYKDNSLFVMIMHAKNLSSPKGTAPDPYIKTYLLPDANKSTKRKTKIVSKNCHPTFMEMLVYNLPFDIVCRKALHVSVWDYDRVQENEFLGATLIPLDFDLKKESTRWCSLGQFNN